MDPSMRKALDEYTRLKESEEFREMREAYEQRFKAQVDYNSQMNGARREGEEKGRKEEGKRIEKINIALKLLKEGLDLGTISRVTELTEEEIEKLKNQDGSD